MMDLEDYYLHLIILEAVKNDGVKNDGSALKYAAVKLKAWPFKYYLIIIFHMVLDYNLHHGFGLQFASCGPKGHAAAFARNYF
jgi:hypothetical protein